jgi:hypothetical protein
MLQREYARWLVIERITGYLNKRAHGHNNQYEMLNIFERFLLRMASVPRILGVHTDAVFVSVTREHSLYRSFVSETNKKNLLRSRAATRAASVYIQEAIEEFLHVQVRHADVHATLEECVFRCEDFTRTLPQERIDALFRRARMHDMMDREDIVTTITTMLLRYACILCRGQQWNLPREWYEFVHAEYDVSIEAFASPINSQLMLIDDGTQFCSLFPDTDAVFGSLGSVFTLQPEHVEGRTVAANPPYVIEIMDNASICIQSWLAQARVCVLFNVVDWTDAKYYKDSMDSPYLVYEKQLAPGTHAYESSNDHDIQKDARVKRIVAKFPTHVFVFTSSTPGTPDVYAPICAHYGV